MFVTVHCITRIWYANSMMDHVKVRNEEQGNYRTGFLQLQHLWVWAEVCCHTEGSLQGHPACQESPSEEKGTDEKLTIAVNQHSCIVCHSGVQRCFKEEEGWGKNHQHFQLHNALSVALLCHQWGSCWFGEGGFLIVQFHYGHELGYRSSHHQSGYSTSLTYKNSALMKNNVKNRYPIKCFWF